MPSRVFLSLGLALTFPLTLAAEEPGPLSFRRDIAPILVKQCLGCHNDAKAVSGLNMSTFALLKKGGKGFGSSILEPGDPDASELVVSVRADASPRMPNKLPPLSDREIRTLEKWVAQGARFDGPSESETRVASLVDPLAGLKKVAVKAKVAPSVRSARFSPDGHMLALAIGQEVRLFDPSTGQLLQTYKEHPGPITSVRFTPDGKTLIAAGGRPGQFGAFSLWNLADGSSIGAFRGHSDIIQEGDLSPDGSIFATASFDRSVTLWKLPDGTPGRTLRDHTDAVLALAFSKDGRRLATAGADRTVKVWDVATGSKLHTLGDSTAEVQAVGFSSDGQTVLAGGVDRSIRAWELSGQDATLKRSVFAHDGAILRLVVSADGQSLVSSGEDRGVKLWSLPELQPRSALGAQSDWPQAIALSPDGKFLVVGRHDGTADLFDPGSGQVLAQIRKPVEVASDKKPEPPPLVRNATLNPPSPRGATRGSTVRLTLTGQGVGAANLILLPEPGLTATIVPAEKAKPDRLELDLRVDKEARVGLHRLSVVTPLGVPGFQTFAVDEHPERTESEPNDDPSRAETLKLPATILGAINKPGDRDHFRIAVEKGRPLVFRLSAKSIGSTLLAGLTVLDDLGKVIGEKWVEEGTRDPILSVTPERDGLLTLRVQDADFGGSGGHYYRISVGNDPLLADVFPLGVAPGESTELAFHGVNLGDLGKQALTPSRDVEPGTLLEVPTGPIPSAMVRRKVVVAGGSQGIEAEPNDASGQAMAITSPGGVSGRIDRSGDADLYRFQARRGAPLIVEVFGRRLDSPIDPVLEILDADGRPLPRAVLRPVNATEVAFRDHNASGSGVRLTRWNNLAMNDTVLFGREVARIIALPKNPDDDCQFWNEQGQRLGFLETTPEHHPMGQPIYKVEVHPPGSTFPVGGVPPVTIHYRNDDGGPGFLKDARITFDPPADGDYLVRVADVRELGGPEFSYHLVIRAPRPGFSVSVGMENPNIHRGGTLLVPISLSRSDGFEGPVEISAEDLPEGITATPTVIERGMFSALLALSAAPTAPAFSSPSWKVRARSVGDDSPGQALEKEVDPGSPSGGRITVIPDPNLTVTPDPDRVTIRPGHEVTMRLSVARSPAFSGRVPIDVRNLPHGVRVLNIGLNGVLVTESQTERTITLYAEPWVSPMTRPFYAVGKAEAAGTEHPSQPIILTLEPGSPATASRSDSGTTRQSP